jgi:tetratricopeptide (TPR) repeat protein
LEEDNVRKITFERAVLIVFILIILISTSDITGKYFEIVKKKFEKPIISDAPSYNLGFSTMLMNADNLYASGAYAEAAEEYLTMILKNTLSIEQKAYAYFSLGVCHYNLGNYNLAASSFSKSASFSTNDSVAYNNAAVSAYRDKDMENAIDLQKKALGILPAVEYYYNLARIYEDNEEYELAANNYLLVAVGEQNITEIERIDPVRVKEKIARLLPQNKVPISETANKLRIALRIIDDRELLTINETEMQIKQNDFIVAVKNQNTSKSIVAEYEREKFDPYNLISELIWTIYKDGKQIIEKSGDKITAMVANSGNYEVKLNIKYNGNKEMASSKVIKIQENQSSINDKETEVAPIIKNNKSEMTYEYAIYEQLFESSFNIRDIGYIDKYSVVWGKDNVYTQLVKSEIDKSNCLLIKNDSINDEGIWLNLDSLIKQDNLYGKKINIRFFARKISESGNLDIKARARREELVILTQRNFELDFKWKEFNMYVSIPKDATGLTISIKAPPGQEFKIDTFLLVD